MPPLSRASGSSTGRGRGRHAFDSVGLAVRSDRPRRSPPVPPLADAFAALLAAEQGAPNPVPAWPPIRVVEVPVVSENLVEQVTRRVLDRLSDRVVRETVADLVSTIAERLIREEIERIKASLK